MSDDPDDSDGLSEVARRSIAGLVAHHRGMAAICAPTVNAYKRLKPDMLNGYWANWGFDDRTVGIRVPPARGEGSRLEHRTADAAANPYLVGAALLHAARMGVVEELELGSAQEPGADPNTDVAGAGILLGGIDRQDRVQDRDASDDQRQAEGEDRQDRDGDGDDRQHANDDVEDGLEDLPIN